MKRTLLAVAVLLALVSFGQTITETFDAASWKPKSLHADLNADNSVTIVMCGTVTGDQGTAKEACATAVAAPGSTTVTRLGQLATQMRNKALNIAAFPVDGGVVLP